MKSRAVLRQRTHPATAGKSAPFLWAIVLGLASAALFAALMASPVAESGAPEPSPLPLAPAPSD